MAAHAFDTEESLSSLIPYVSHLTDSIVLLENGSIMTVLRLEGAAHETASDLDLLQWHESYCNALMAVAAPDLALWRTTHHHEISTFAGGVFEEGSFAHALNEAYAKRCAKESLFGNALYLAVLLKGPDTFAKFGRGKGGLALAREEQMARLEGISTRLEESFARYKPRRLTTYQDLNVRFSEVYEYLSLIINGRMYKTPITPHRAGDVLKRCRITFGSDTFVRDFSDRREFGALLAANTYPSGSINTGHLNKTLSLPFEYVMTNSFTFMGQQEAKQAVDMQQRRMKATGDEAEQEMAAFKELKAALQTRSMALGHHDMTICVWADDQKTLTRRLGMAEENCTDNGFLMSREDIALKPAFVAQLPGNYKFRPRRAPITNRNFAAIAAFHNYPMGRKDGNQWGPATTMFLTEGGSPFFASLHDMRKARTRGGAESQDDKAPGNTLVLGPTGGGKTTLQTFLVAQADKAKPTVFTFDRSQGQAIFVKSMGGRYSVLERGKRTGFNFIALEPTQQNLAFAIDMSKRLASGGNRMPPDVENDIADRVRYLMTQGTSEEKNLTYLSHGLDAGSEWTQRLSQWCEGGPHSWAFCSTADELDFRGTRHFGWDATNFLGDKETRVPITAYLFHRVNSYLGTRPTIINIDEMRAFLKDDFFREFIEDTLLLIRKKDGLAFLGTQQASHVLDSEIAETLCEQTQTKIILPNMEAQHKHYVGGLGLSEGEFDLIQSDLPNRNPRGFLFKQASVSAVCNLNLAGMTKELAVLSGTDQLISKMHAAIQMTSDDPRDWLPVYYEILRSN